MRGAVVGLQGDAQVEFDDTVGAFDCPVVAAWQHLAAKPFAFERAARDWIRDARAREVLRRRPAWVQCSGAVSSGGAFAWQCSGSAGGGEEAASGTWAHPASVASAASLRISLRRTSMASSQDLVDRVDGTLGPPIAARDSEEAIQERVLRVPGLEPRRGAEVNKSRDRPSSPRAIAAITSGGP